MLLRQFHEWLREAETIVSASHARQVKPLRERLEKSQRIVFAESAFLACRQLAEHPDQLDRAKTQIFAPFPQLWMEFPSSLTPNGTRVSEGFLWMGEDCGRKGGLVYIGWPRGCEFPTIIPATVDLDRDATIRVAGGDFADRGIAALQHRFGSDQRFALTGTEMRAAVPEMLQWALAGWALLATVGMTHSQSYDPTTLNRSRVKRGLYPLLAYSEIRLNLDVERAVRAKQMAEGRYTNTMPLHPVRAHLRLLPTGRVVIVRAHMRGNPEYGIKSHHYTVVRAEDEIA